MNSDTGKIIIYLYNLFTLCLWPMIIFLGGYWSIEANPTRRFGGEGKILLAVVTIFVPEVIFGLKMDLNKTFGGRIFTILCSMAHGWILHKILYYVFVMTEYAPRTYYTTHILLVLGIIWTIVIEFNQTLREHILLFPRDQWLFPNSEDQTEHRYWRGFFYALLGLSAAYTLIW